MRRVLQGWKVRRGQAGTSMFVDLPIASWSETTVFLLADSELSHSSSVESMSSEEKEIVGRLKEVGNRLLESPSSIEHLLKFLEILEDGMRIRNGIKLSLVQGYLSKFYRNYGIWVARRSRLVLFLSLGTVLVLCLGLIRFKVETRPEKLWVGPGRRAAREKQFFDNHLAPFYRIEELIIATMPNEANGKAQSILTDDNLKLLFEIQKKVDGLRANYSGSVVSLTDICLKPLGGDCATQSVLQDDITYLFHETKNTITMQGDIAIAKLMVLSMYVTGS